MRAPPRPLGAVPRVPEGPPRRPHRRRDQLAALGSEVLLQGLHGGLRGEPCPRGLRLAASKGASVAAASAHPAAAFPPLLVIVVVIVAALN